MVAALTVAREVHCHWLNFTETINTKTSAEPREFRGGEGRGRGGRGRGRGRGGGPRDDRHSHTGIGYVLRL